MTADSPRLSMVNSAGRITPRDFRVPDAPNTAMWRFSLVSLGKQTTLPFFSPKMMPSACDGGLISRISFSSLSFIHEAVP